MANEVRTAFDIHRSKLEAAEDLRQNAVQALDENETLARRSFEEGEINLLDLLLIRRDASEMKLIYLNQLLETKGTVTPCAIYINVVYDVLTMTGGADQSSPRQRVRTNIERPIGPSSATDRLENLFWYFE